MSSDPAVQVKELTFRRMPPKRRRLVVWVLWWLMLLSVVPEIVLDALGVPQPWRSFAYAAVVVAIFTPLIRGAVDHCGPCRTYS
jgi:hypothetical protein